MCGVEKCMLIIVFNWNSIIYREGAVHRTLKEKLFLAAKCFNTNNINNIFYRCIMSLLVIFKSAPLQTQLPMCMDVHLKQFYVYKISCTKNCNLWSPVPGVQELEITFFCAPNNMSLYTIVHLTFHAPQIVVCAHVYADMYLAVQLLERQKYLHKEQYLHKAERTFPSLVYLKSFANSHILKVVIDIVSFLSSDIFSSGSRMKRKH